mmetsp:Transcript_50289/g.127981  ORF Transcript_50289/g.127981 Transcript_50289/m.127981 type:complete len:367 (+) Transcript_50289:80-1180(+)
MHQHLLLSPGGDTVTGAMEMGRQGARRLLRFRLRGGADEDALGATFAGFVFGFLFLVWGLCISTLSPNDYGLRRNFLTGGIGTQVERGGIHLTGPFLSFIPFPAAQTTLEWANGAAERPPISSRTGADPNDPDSGGQPIQISCAVQIQFVKESIREVYFSFGSYEAARQRYLLLAGNVVSNTAQDFVPQDFWSDRDRIAEKMLHKINGTLWEQGYVVATRFEIMKVNFADKFEESITAIQVAEQSKVVNEYDQQVQQVVQSIEVLQSEVQAAIANISAGADATSKEIRAHAQRDAFALKQGMKAKKYAELRDRLGFTTHNMQEFFKINVLQSQNNGNKVVIGISGVADPAPKAADKQAARIPKNDL